jgi:hypothetical protein
VEGGNEGGKGRKRTGLNEQEKPKQDRKRSILESSTDVRNAKTVVVEDRTATPVVDLDDGLVFVGVLNEGTALRGGQF